MDAPAESPKVDRKTAIKIGVVTTLGALVTQKTGETVLVAEKGLITKSATFYPLYERHTGGIKVEDIPSDADGFFREINKDSSLYDDPPSNILNDSSNLWKHPDGSPVMAFERPVLKKLANQQTRVILGDTNIHGLAALTSSMLPKFAEMAGFVAAAGLAFRKAIESYDPKRFEGIDEAKMSRRKLFYKGLVLYGTSHFLLPFLDRGDPGGKNAARRILTRLEGLIEGHLSPEDVAVFFRSAYMASKMLTVADKMKQELGRNPKIAFHMGGAHSGIEDFLAAGPEFTRWIIMIHPKGFLRDVIRTQGGIENFSSARVITLSKNLDPNDPEGMVERDEKITDEKLAKMIGNLTNSSNPARELRASR